jgi:hypothetical protein
MRPIAGFHELIAALDDLIAMAQAGGANAELVHSLGALRRRLTSIHAFLGGEPLDELSSPAEEPPGADEETVLHRLDRLVEAAERGGLDPALTDYLRSAALRLMRVHEGAEDLRLAPRRPRDEGARLEVGDDFHEVRILDRSALGFGVSSPVPVEADEFVRIVVEDVYGSVVYDCLVIHCQARPEDYLLGLDIFGRPRSGGA